MPPSKKPFIFIILLIILFLMITVQNSYSQSIAFTSSPVLTITPGYNIEPQNNPIYPEETAGAADTVSFLELPLWIQLTYLSFIAAGIFALLKVLPFISGRLKTALENPKTKEIFFHIQNNPGLTIKELSDEQNINRGTLRYHLSQLFENNKITLIRKGKVSQLYHNTMSPMDKESIIASYLRRNDNSRSILFSIMDNPGVTNKDLSEKFNLDKSTITDYMKNFSNDDIVEFRQDGKFKRCYVKQDARMIMLRFRPQ